MSSLLFLKFSHQIVMNLLLELLMQANVRDYYMQYEAQQNQYIIDQRIKAHLGQTGPYQQVGAAFNQMRPRLPVLPTPMMPPMQGGPMPVNSPLMPGMRPPVLPRPGKV